MECLFVLKILLHTQRATEVKKTCRVFSETASFKSYGYICLPMASYSGIPHNFLMAELSKAFKKANSRLNTT